MNLLFFFNDTATTEIYTLSIPDALPISAAQAASSCRTRSGEQERSIGPVPGPAPRSGAFASRSAVSDPSDRKSTRLNSSHSQISYAVFCLKKKKVIQSE